MSRCQRTRTERPTRRCLLRGVVALGTLALASGCGQTGPLYFPEDRLEEEKAKRKR